MKNKNIVIYTMSLWDEPNRGRHHLANQLSKDNKVIWVNRKLDRFDNYNPFIGLQKISSNLSVLHTGPSIFPNFIPRRVDEWMNINNYLRLKILLKVINDENFSPDIIWIYDYKALNVVKFFQNKCTTLYFCNDFYGDYAYSYEKKLVKSIDFIFSTDPRLKKRFQNINSNSHYIPHGSWPVSSQPIFEKKNEPESIGYIGTINDTLDINVFSMILEKTKLKIIIAGPFSECNNKRKVFFKNFFKNKRVQYHGDLEQKDRELVIKKLDVCLLPYHPKVNGFALKFFDYISFGKPIFSTEYDFPWPSNYKKFIRFYNDEMDIDNFIFNMYKSWDINHFNDAISLSKKSRWSDRVSKISKKLNLKL